jgi:hypothetical protein
MRNRREDIDYHNRKFKLHLTGTRDLGDFTFRIQPPNETANSNNYNQCLVKISKAVLTNRGDTITGGLDAVPVSGTIAASVREVCPTGILLTTGVRCSNEIHYTSFTSVPIEQGLQVILHNKNGASHNGAAIIGGGVVAGAALCQRGVAAAGGGVQGSNADIFCANTWEYQDDRPIEESGILAGNIFASGGGITCALRNPNNGSTVFMASNSNFGNVLGYGSSLQIEIDVLMLPNPRPEDRS